MNAFRSLCLMVPAALMVCPPAGAQPLPYEDVVRSLRNPDPDVRMSAVRLLRDAKYPEAVVPLAALVNDPLDEIQLEVMDTEMAFFLVSEVPRKKKIAFLLEVRADGRAARAFEMGPLATWPTRAPAELVKGLLDAVDDENGTVRQEAIYTLGVIGLDALKDEHAKQLIVALDHYDPAIRAGAARVIGRLRVASAGDALIKAMNDSDDRVRYASMRALGEIGDARALKALTDQFTYYGKGEGAWSALEALARIAHPGSVELFTSRLADRDPFIRRAAAEGLGRAGHLPATEVLQDGAITDESPMVRAAMAFALYKLGHNYLGRMVDYLHGEATARQVQGYLLELGPAVVPGLLPALHEPEAATRRRLVEVLGAIGEASTIDTLAPLLKDRDRDVQRAATNAIERIKMRTG